VSPARRFGVAAVAVSVAVAVAVGTTQAAWSEHVVSLQRFQENVTRSLAVARQGQSQPSPFLMREVRGALGLPTVVTGPGWQVSVASDPLLASLRGTSRTDFLRASSRLTALAGAASAAGRSTTTDPAAVRAALAQAYRGIVVGSPSFAERVRAWIDGLRWWLLEHLLSFQGPATLLTWLVLLLILGVLVYAAYRAGAFREVRVGLVRERSAPASPGEDERDPLTEALAALARGDSADGVRALYRAMLRSLQSRGVVEDSPSVTAGECRVALRVSRPALAPVIVPATEVYERVVYGGETPAREEVEAVRQAELRARSA